MKRVIKFTLEIRSGNDKIKPVANVTRKRKQSGIIELIKGVVIKIKGL